MWLIDEDAPPPPPLKEVRQLKIPADLHAVRPALNPYTAAIVAAQPAPPAQANVPATLGVIATPVLPAAATPKAVEPRLFAPYYPTEAETKYPEKWETQPQYPFPWIMGATPSRVNEETVLGSGDRMMGRLFARVSYEKLIPVTGEPMLEMPVKPVVMPPAPEQENSSFLSKIKKTIMGESSPPSAPAATAKAVQKFVVCEAATCLDAARDALMADAKMKGWELLLSRRVSLHQSFQFRKNDRITLIEIDSDGKKVLDIEYGLLPTQNTITR